MFAEYLPAALQAGIALAFVAAMLIVPPIVAKKGAPNPAKDSAYECGLPAAQSGRPRFSIKFYLVAILFVLFDIEVVFLYPWAVVYKEMLREGLSILFSMLTFLAILFLGFLYVWKKGALDWK
ncbi:MAG: NADH-quinone oxidoreductase subunit A [Verrucomicrobiae bacterium]|nr:NADH-quinone oxidoreductase subunit A [Verrucomicrobiae bacterium]